MTDACVFCDIVDGKSNACIVFQDEISIAFLDTRPLFHGHTLLIPRKHISTLEQMPEELIGPFFLNVRILTTAVERATGSDGSFTAINSKVSQSVPHLHVHIVPRKKKDGLRGFFWPRIKYNDENRIEDYCEKIKSEILKLDI